MGSNGIRQIPIQMREVREAATEHDHVRVEDVDNDRKRAREPVEVTEQ